LQLAYDGNTDAFVAKLNPSGSALVYSTYLGGSGVDGGGGIAVDSAGNAYISGTTSSIDFPTVNPLQPAYGGGDRDAFVAKINPSGSALVYSTYLGGSGNDIVGGGGFAYYGRSIAVDGAGSTYVTGGTTSTDFPTTPGAVQTICNGGSGCENFGDGFVARLNPAGSALVYSTYLGGKKYDNAYAIDAGSAGSAYVTGETSGDGFPRKGGSQLKYGGGNYDAFVAKIDMRGATITTLSSSPNPSMYGQAVTFIAQVTSSLGAPPDGETVTFKKGATVLGTGTLSGGSTSTTSTRPVGTNSINAVYGGDSNLVGSTSKAVKQVVRKATTTTTLASSQNSSKVGQSVTFTATVTPEFSGTVKGTVTFYDGTTALKTVSLSSGVAKFTTSKLTHGTHTITATYNGSTSFIGSSASLTQTVN
jgi:hypothetical protein